MPTSGYIQRRKNPERRNEMDQLRCRRIQKSGTIFLRKTHQGELRKKKRNIKTVEQVRKEAEEERIRMQSAAYYELNRPTKEWVYNSHLLDTDYDEDEDDYGR